VQCDIGNYKGVEDERKGEKEAGGSYEWREGRSNWRSAFSYGSGVYFYTMEVPG